MSEGDWRHLGNELGLSDNTRQPGVLVAQGRDIFEVRPTSDQQKFDDVLEQLYQLQERKEDLKQRETAARRSAYAQREDAVGSRVQYELGTAPTRVSEQPIFAPIAIEVPYGVSDALLGLGDLAKGGLAGLADMTVAPVLDVAQAGVKALHGAVTGDFQPLVPMSSYGNSADSGAALKAAGVNVFNVSPVGMIYHAGTGGYGFATAAMNGDVRAATREGVGLGLNFAGAKAMGFERYGFVVNDIGATGSGRYQRGAIGLMFTELPQGGGGRATNNTAHSAYQYELLKRDLLRQEIANPGEAMSGPVVLRNPVAGATPLQVDQIRRYAAIGDLSIAEGYLSPTGRVSTTGKMRTAADAAAAEEKARAIAAGRPYTGVAGHGVDTTWTGRPVAPFWLDMDKSLNSSLGRQAQNYPLGYKPTKFIYEKDLNWTGNGNW